MINDYLQQLHIPNGIQIVYTAAYATKDLQDMIVANIHASEELIHFGLRPKRMKNKFLHALPRGEILNLNFVVKLQRQLGLVLQPAG